MGFCRGQEDIPQTQIREDLGEGFDKLVQYFSNEYDCEVFSKVDGPDARLWEIGIKGQIVNLVHDDMLGNFFYSKNASAEPLLESLASKLEKRIEENRD